MRLGITIVLVLTVISKESCRGQFPYKFSSASEEALCDTIVMAKLGDWRRLSLTPMKRDGANGCCNKKGMDLISDNVGVKGDLVGRYIIELHNAANNAFWTSANDRTTPGTFVWSNGLKLGTSSLYQFENDNVKKHGHCVLMEVISADVINLKTANCEAKHPFVCELQPRRAGEILSEEDMQKCEDIQYVELMGLPNLRWGHKAVSFPLARYCCDQQGWSIIDETILKNLNLLEKAYQDPDFQKTTGLKFKYYVPHSFWLGYNDMCQETVFQWNCGSKATYESGPDELWIHDAPDNEDGNEHCVELSLRIETKQLQMNDIDCDFPGTYFVCITNGTCPEEKRFRCEKKRNVIIDEEWENEKPECGRLTFQFIGEGEHYKYFLSDQSLTWSGAVHCLAEKEYDIASFEIEDEIQFLTPRYLDSRKRQTSSVLPEIWNTATNWLLPSTSDIMWNGDRARPIKKEHRIYFRTHDEMYPICGKTGVHKGAVGVLSEDCLRKLRFIYKDPFNLPLPSHNRTNITERINPPVTTSSTPRTNTGSYEDIDDYEYVIEEYGDPYDPINRYRLGGVTMYALECDDDKLLAKYQKKCPHSSLSPGSCPHSRNVSKEILTKILLQNNRLRAVTIKRAVDNYQTPYHEPKLSFKLFKKATEIYWHVCPNVAPAFLQNAFDLFHDLHRITSQGRSTFLTKAEYNWIFKILTKCYENINGLLFTTDQCGNPIMGVGSCLNFICTNSLYEFNIYNSDPLVDVMWFIYELIHSACFPYFSESYRMFHKFANAIMDVWTTDIKLRWRNQIEDTKFWKRILGPFYETDLVNMQRCNTATIKLAQLNLRLAKQQKPNRIRLHGADPGDDDTSLTAPVNFQQFSRNH